MKFKGCKYRNDFQITILIGFLAICIIAHPASAQPQVRFDVSVSGDPIVDYNGGWNQTGSETAGSQVYEFVGNHSDLASFGWSIDWNFDADPFPTGEGSQLGAFLDAGFTARNLLPDGLTAADNHLFFSIQITMDVVPSSQPTVFDGFAAMHLDIDQSLNNFPGQLKASGGPMWNYIVNDVDVTSLYPNGFFIGGTNGPSKLDTDVLLDATSLGGLSPNSIGIRLDFQLTPGEIASFNGNFAFAPAPGVISLFILAAGCPVRRSRRRA